MRQIDKSRLKNLRSKQADPKCLLTPAEQTSLKRLLALEQQAAKAATPATPGSTEGAMMR